MSNSMTIEKVLCLIVGGQIANFGKKSPGHLIVIKKWPNNTPSPSYEILIIFPPVHFIRPLQLGTKEYEGIHSESLCWNQRTNEKNVFGTIYWAKREDKYLWISEIHALAVHN